MDEMRQLVRILVKLMPDSLAFLAVSDEGGGGNRVSEDQIKDYMKRTLGKDPPEPEWGLPNGWGEYLAGAVTQRAGQTGATWVMDPSLCRSGACQRGLPMSWRQILAAPET